MKKKLIGIGLVVAVVVLCILVPFLCSLTNVGGDIRQGENKEFVGIVTAAKSTPAGLGYQTRPPVPTAPADQPLAEGMTDMQWRSLSLTNQAFQAWASNYMIGAVRTIVQAAPIYGLPALPAKVKVAGQMWGDNAQITLATEDLTRFIFDNGAVRKIEVKTQLPTGSFEEEFSAEQKSAAMATLRQAPDKTWTDQEVKEAFNAVASLFGITPGELGSGVQIERTKVKVTRSLQQMNAPAVPNDAAKPGLDAFIAVSLKNRDAPDSNLFKVTFRTEPSGTGYRLAVVELNNNNFRLQDPNTRNLQQRFF